MVCLFKFGPYRRFGSRFRPTWRLLQIITILKTLRKIVVPTEPPAHSVAFGDKIETAKAQRKESDRGETT
jgi:hypothetical protein